MASQYDKLGEMLKDAIESGKFPDEKKSEKQKTEENFFKESKIEEKKDEKTQNKHRNYNKKSDLLDNSVQKFIHLYKIFNLQPGCSAEELKDSFRKLLKKYHPDNFNGFPETQKMAERKTRELIAAFKKLLELIG